MNNIEELKKAALVAKAGNSFAASQSFKMTFTPDCILNLIAQLEAAQKERDGLREKVNQSDTEWQEMADRILAVGKRAEKAENESGLLAVQFEIATERAGINFDRAQKAEAALSAANEKLLKPVKLPKTNGYWDAEEQAFERGIQLARQEIRIAGFRVEGDE
ncbi:hypothetical protein [Yersinia massiliensis]|nr:hypothetical protein [Yersinia massiliensis]MDA5547590.1 hypothetical protein [Yersinia massiliensis]